MAEQSKRTLDNANVVITDVETGRMVTVDAPRPKKLKFDVSIL